MNEYERRLAEIKKRPRTLQASLRPEHEAFLSSLSINALKWLNQQMRRRPEAWEDKALGDELAREALQLSDLDKAGLLTEYWWCK